MPIKNEETLLREAKRVMHAFKMNTGNPGDPAWSSTMLAKRMNLGSGTAHSYLRAMEFLGCATRQGRSGYRWIDPGQEVSPARLNEERTVQMRRRKHGELTSADNRRHAQKHSEEQAAEKAT